MLSCGILRIQVCVVFSMGVIHMGQERDDNCLCSGCTVLWSDWRPTNLLIALMNAQAEFPIIKESSKNAYLKNTYARYPDVIKAIKDIMPRNGLTYFHAPVSVEHDIVYTYILHAQTGEWISGYLKLLHSGNNDQERNSSITYARRYLLLCLLGIASDGEDDDGNDASLRSNGSKRGTGSALVTPDQIKHIRNLCGDDETLSQLLRYYQLSSLQEMKQSTYQDVVKRVSHKK